MMNEMPYSLGWNDVRQKPSGKFEARWADETGHARGRCFITKAQAQKYALDRANGIVNTALGMGVSRKPINEATIEFSERRLNEKTTALNERRIGEFTSAFPTITTVGQITDRVIMQFDKMLEQEGHNPGGRHHHLKIVRTFTNFCMRKKWLSDNPFNGFKMPKSTFEGRALNAEEFARATVINPRYPVDVHLRDALCLGRLLMLRISQIWKLTPSNFRAPDQLWIEGIKDQDGVWVELHPAALVIMRHRMNGRSADQRLFDHWSSVESMRNSVEDKMRRVGLPGVRFHDACKVSRVTELSQAGFTLGDLAHLSNTSQKTLMAHYIKTDRAAAFAAYKKLPDLPQTYKRPEMGLNTTVNRYLEPVEASISKDEIAANSQPIPA